MVLFSWEIENLIVFIFPLYKNLSIFYIKGENETGGGGDQQLLSISTGINST